MSRPRTLTRPNLSPTFARAVAEVEASPERFIADDGELDRGALAALGRFSPLGDDVETLAFLVLMEAAKSAREDLKAIMDGVKAINQEKQAWREVAATLGAITPAGDQPSFVIDCDVVPCGSLHSLRTQPIGASALDGDQLRVNTPTRDGSKQVGGLTLELTSGAVPRVDLDRAMAEIHGKLDSLTELGEMESLRLQMALDRLSKLMSTLSNLLEKASGTASTIIQNLK